MRNVPGAFIQRRSGNWGVDSNGGSRFNGDQFAGWRSGDHWEWNSCKNDFPQPNCTYYNATGCTEQASAATDSQLYTAFSFVSNTDASSGCAAFNGSQFTLTGNYMDMWELDPFDFDEFVGTLNYPNLTATRNCTFFDCDATSSGWTNANGGDTGLLSAQVQMTISGTYDEEPIGPHHEDLSNAALAQHGDSNSWPFRLVSLSRRTGAKLSWWVPSDGPSSSPWLRVPTRSQANSQNGTIVGSVSGSKGPIAGARVMVVNRHNSSVEVRTVRTDIDGQFKLEDMNSDRHEILVAASGYGRRRIVVAVRSNSVEQVAVTLPLGGEIAGTVLDPSGNPVRDAKLTIRYSSPPRGGAPDQILADWHRGMLITDDNGVFRIQDVQPGEEFYVVVEHATRGREIVGPLSIQSGRILPGLLVRLVN